MNINTKITVSSKIYTQFFSSFATNRTLRSSSLVAKDAPYEGRRNVETLSKIEDV